MSLKDKISETTWKEKAKGLLSFRNITALILVPLVSIFAYRVVSEPLLTKTVVRESLIQTMSEQPEIILDSIIDNLPENKQKITEQERNNLKKEISKAIMDSYTNVTEEMGLDIGSLMEEVELLKQGSANKQEVKALKDEIDKIKTELTNNLEANKELDNSTKEEIKTIIEAIEEVEKELTKAEQVDNNLAERISSILNKLTALKKNMNEELDKLREQLELLKKDTSTNTETKINDVQGQIDALNELHKSLNARLTEFIKTVNIDALNETITNFALSISSLDAGLSNVQNSVERIDLSMVTLEDMLNSNIENVDEELKKEIQDVLAKMKKLSEDVYDKSIVDKHIEAIQNALDSIMANAGELDEELKNKFSQAQKDLEELKQETESGYYDKIAVNNKITEINSSLSDGLAELSAKADANLKDAITKVESDLTDFGKNVEAAYKQAINTEVANLKNELQASINAAAEANRQNAEDITNLQGETSNIGNAIEQLMEQLNRLDGDFANLTTQLETVKTNINNGYYTKEQMDLVTANIQTALETIKTDVKNNSDRVSANGANIIKNETAVTNLETSLATLNENLSTNIQSVNGRIDSLDTRVNECFQSASNGKNTVATAITGKGVQASKNDTFNVLANKIGQIQTGTKVRYWVLPGNGTINMESELGNIYPQLGSDDFIVSAEYGNAGFEAGGDHDNWTGHAKCSYSYNPSNGLLTATHMDERTNNQSRSVREHWAYTSGEIYVIYKGRL